MMDVTHIQDTSSQDRVIPKKMNLKKMIGWTALGLLSLALVYGAFSSYKRGSADAVLDLSRIRTAAVVKGDLVREVAVEGRVVAAFYPALYSPAEGVVELSIRAGQTVEKDQVLATVISEERANLLKQEASQLAALQAERDRAEIQVKVDLMELAQDADLKMVRKEAAEREAKRANSSFDKGLINRADLEKALDDQKLAELEAEHAQQKLTLEKERLIFELENRKNQVARQALVVEEAQRRVDELVVRSPVSGVVGSVNVNPRDRVQVNQQICSVIDLSAFEIALNIPEGYTSDLRPGSPAEITYENQAYPGLVSSISPEVRGGLVEGRLAFSGELPAGMKQNQRVSVRILLDRKDQVLKVQRGPFLETGGGTVAYRIQGEYAERIDIRTGIASVAEIEIAQGLNEGDQIIISDLSQLGKAQKVLISQ